MASPLRWFRRHATLFMVTFGVAAMAIFGLGPVFDTLTTSMQSSGDVENPTVAKWTDGDITRFDLDGKRVNHFQMQRFLEGLRQSAQAKAAREEVEFRSMAQPIPMLRQTTNGEQEYYDEQIIDRMLMAERAKQEGMSISDGMIDDYIALASGDAQFSRRDLMAINKEANRGQCSLETVREHLKLELLASQMRNYTMTGLPLVPNATEAMELYSRTNDRIECEVIPVKVSDYLTSVSEEPSALQVQEIYDQGKYQYPDPTGERPGFKIDRHMKLQYFLANFDTFQQNEINKLSDADVQAEYDRLVTEKDDMVMEIIPDASIETGEALPGIELNLGGENETEPAGEAPVGDAMPDANAPASETAVPTEMDEGVTEEGVEESDQSMVVQRAKAEFVSMTQEETADEVVQEGVEAVQEGVEVVQEGVEVVQEAEGVVTEITGAVQTETTDTPAAEVMTESANQAAAVPAETDATTVEAAQTETTTPAENTQAATGEVLPDEGMITDSAVPQDVGPMLGSDSEIEKRVVPLADVADKLKRRMTQVAASRAMDDAVQRAEAKMAVYQNKWMRWNARNEMSPKDAGEKPEMPNFNEVADEFNLEFGETGLVDEDGIAEEKIGQVYSAYEVTGPTGQTRRVSLPIAQVVFTNYALTDLFEPNSVRDIIGSSAYVYWMSEKEDTRVPELDEVKDDVIKFWKGKKALEKAVAEAQKMADKVNSVGDKLTTVYPNKAAPTGEFTWFQNFGGDPGLGKPIGVPKPSEEFMQRAFASETMKAGVATNETKDTVYVVQRTSDLPPITETGTSYMENQFFKFKRVPQDVTMASNYYLRQLDLGWNQDFVDSMKLEMVK